MRLRKQKGEWWRYKQVCRPRWFCRSFNKSSGVVGIPFFASVGVAQKVTTSAGFPDDKMSSRFCCVHLHLQALLSSALGTLRWDSEISSISPSGFWQLQSQYKESFTFKKKKVPRLNLIDLVWVSITESIAIAKGIEYARPGRYAVRTKWSLKGRMGFSHIFHLMYFITPKHLALQNRGTTYWSYGTSSGQHLVKLKVAGQNATYALS